MYDLFKQTPEVVDLRCRLVTCEIDGSKQFCRGTGENTSFFLCAYSFVDGMLMVVLKQLIQQIQLSQTFKTHGGQTKLSQPEAEKSNTRGLS